MKQFNPIKNLKHFAHPARLPTGAKIGKTLVKKTRGSKIRKPKMIQKETY